MSRKWSVCAVLMTSFALVVTSAAIADDEDSPIHKLMEKVTKSSNSIKKAIRTSVAYKKDQPSVVKHAEELIELGKQAREMKESSEKAKKPFGEWQKLMDDYIKKTGEFKDLVAKGGTTKDDQAAAKKAYSTVNASCTACHNEYRIEDPE